MYEQRYMVEWTPWDAVKAAAKKRGMPEGGEVSNYVDAGDYERGEVCQTFATAMQLARKLLPGDMWGCPRIRRQVLVQNDHDDLGNRVSPMPSFETEATWEVFSDEPDPREDSPDWLDVAA